jgi:hypothetical protein
MNRETVSGRSAANLNGSQRRLNIGLQANPDAEPADLFYERFPSGKNCSAHAQDTPCILTISSKNDGPSLQPQRYGRPAMSIAAVSPKINSRTLRLPAYGIHDRVFSRGCDPRRV